ncbi:CHAD domain-containing protein [Streptomyces sp. NPDC059578]|uniref:CYTH and CHAD domain-containing protein n=1 Tax=unclassified Streptomyces TaxID=2593676 RepID=UPI003653B3B6
MADIQREIERKYEATDPNQSDRALPDLTAVGGVSAVVHQGVTELDAVYYDTVDHRLAAASITLRRRTGGADAGWHLKLPVARDVRDEIRAPLSATPPRTLTGLVRSRVRSAPLVPVIRLRSTRDVHHLVDADGTLLAELSVDVVRAQRLTGGDATTTWTEVEVELGRDQRPAFLDKVEKKLRKGGLRRSASASKLSRALAETTADRHTPVASDRHTPAVPDRHTPATAPRPPHEGTAAAPVLAYLAAQRDAIVALDPAVRRNEYDSVHRLRVATRRARSAFRSYSKVLDRAVTDPVGAELKWLAGELGIDRDAEVLTERLTGHFAELPRNLVIGPVRTRLRTWAHARRGGSRRRLITVLNGKRYLALLDALDALLADPPLLPAAARDATTVLHRAARKDFGKLAALVEEALERPSGPARDLAMHEARKKAKRLRYAAEAALDTLGKPAKQAIRGSKALQDLLGEHQDSVMTRTTLRDLATQAHAARENAFTYGLIHGHEERRADGYEAELPAAWEAAERATRGLRGTR